MECQLQSLKRVERGEFMPYKICQPNYKNFIFTPNRFVMPLEREVAIRIEFILRMSMGHLKLRAINNMRQISFNQK